MLSNREKYPLIARRLAGYCVAGALLATGLAACSGATRHPEQIAADESAEDEVQLSEHRQLIAAANSCAERGAVDDTDLIMLADWAAALTEAYSVWAPGHSASFRGASEKLAVCVSERGLEGRPSAQASEGAQRSDFETAADEVSASTEDTRELRRLGDANRCISFLEDGLLTEDDSPSCRRMAQLGGSATADGTSSESHAGAKSAYGAMLLRTIAQLLSRQSADEGDAPPFPVLDRALRRITAERFEALRVAVPLTPEYIEEAPSRQLPRVLIAPDQLPALDQSAIDSIVSFEASLSYIADWPAVAYDSESREVVNVSALGEGGGRMDLREAHARSVSPQRVSVQQVRERRLVSENASSRSSLAGHPEKRALVLAHRLGVWAALRPGLCAAYEFGVQQFAFAASTSESGAETVSDIVSLPMFVRVTHPDLPSSVARVTEIEAREDGFLATLPNGDAQAFPFVEGDAYMKLYGYLHENAVTDVTVKAEPRVELQIIASLAAAIAWDRGSADGFSSDRELMRAPLLADTPATRVGVQLRCAPVAE